MLYCGRLFLDMVRGMVQSDLFKVAMRLSQGHLWKILQNLCVAAFLDFYLHLAGLTILMLVPHSSDDSLEAIHETGKC